MTDSIIRHSLRTAGIMLGFTIVGTALLAYTFSITRNIIAHNEELAKLESINQALPHGLYDNDIINDMVMLQPSEDLGTDQTTPAYRARIKGEPVALVLEAIAPDGYSGKISMLIAILASGEIAGVRVVTHNETPGLGDYIDIAKSEWIRIFDHTALAKYQESAWKVKKDGGAFDYMTGATITPRAVVKAVHKTLLYFEKHKKEIFAQPALKKEQPK